MCPNIWARQHGSSPTTIRGVQTKQNRFGLNQFINSSILKKINDLSTGEYSSAVWLTSSDRTKPILNMEDNQLHIINLSRIKLQMDIHGIVQNQYGQGF